MIQRQITNHWPFVLSVIFLFFGIVPALFAAPADLDPAFGVGGKVVTNPTAYATLTGYSVALMPDGKIVAVGGAQNQTSAIFFIAKFNTDGSYDTTFGDGGWAAIPGFGKSIAVQPDGKIIIAGSAYIIRLTSNGGYDTSFDGDGVVIVDTAASGTSELLQALALAPDGKIVYGGSDNPSYEPNYRALIGRLNANGSPDTTFAPNGYITTGPGTVEDLVVLPDGSIFATGEADSQIATTLFSTRINPNGTVAWSNSNFGPRLSRHYGVAAQPDGKLIIVGWWPNTLIMKRFLPDGSVDGTFVSPTLNGTARSVALQPDGKIVVPFALPVPVGGTIWKLLRCNPDGSFDPGFGSSGVATTEIGLSATPVDVLIQPDGKIISLGWTFIGGGYSLAMTRYRGGRAVNSTMFDFDGDGNADISVFRPSENKWYVLRSSDQGVTQQVFAISGDAAVPADYDGDRKTDLAIFRPSTGDWWSLSSLSGGQIFSHWGANGDIPRPSDFDGDGRADYVVFRPSNNFWYRISSSTGNSSNSAFGSAGDKPVTGDFDGDGKSDLAIYRPSTGEWWWQSSVNGAQLATRWGISTDVPVPGDYDGDGKTDFAVYRPSTGTWYAYNSATLTSTIINFGLAEDKPVAADYDGDGRADIAVFRPSTGIWYVMRSTAGFAALQFGVFTDVPTPNAYIP